jgi:hypothetical protein
MPLVLESATKILSARATGRSQTLLHISNNGAWGGRLTESIAAAYATFSATVVLWLEVWQFSNPAIAGYKCDHQFHLCQCEPQLSIGQFQNMPAAFMLGAICSHGMVPTHSTLNGASDSKDQASPNDFHSFAVSISTTYSKICLL